MKADIAKKWSDALRSGKYKQSRGALHNNEGFCCLGVLCELAIANGVALDVSPGTPKLPITKYNETWYVLPRAVQEWSGACTPGAVLDLSDGTMTLATYNDTGHTFEQIADIIDANVDKL